MHTKSWRYARWMINGIECCCWCTLFRFMVPSHPVCLERGVTYTLRFEFTRYQDANSVLNGAANAILFVDSVRSIHSVRKCPTDSQRSSCAINFSLFFSQFLPHWSVQISLMPRHSSMEMFNAGDPTANSRKQNYERYRCHDSAKTVSRNLMSNTCSKLISSMSAIINDGALRECLWLTFSWTSGRVTWPCVLH